MGTPALRALRALRAPPPHPTPHTKKPRQSAPGLRISQLPHSRTGARHTVDTHRPDNPEAALDQEQICDELDRVRADFGELLDTATVAELRGPSNGTKWTNEQLLFHMLFGYLLVRNLRYLVLAFARLPDSASRRFASALNAGTQPFHVINYIGSLGGARLLGYARMERLMDHVITSLQTSLRHSSTQVLDRGMHFPVGWDPYFKDTMTLRDVYHYATQHYDHHRRQLTLTKTLGS